MSIQPAKSRLQVDISPEAKKNLRIYAAMTGVTMSEAIEEVFTQRIRELGLQQTERLTPAEA